MYIRIQNIIINNLKHVLDTAGDFYVFLPQWFLWTEALYVALKPRLVCNAGHFWIFTQPSLNGQEAQFKSNFQTLRNEVWHRYHCHIWNFHISYLREVVKKRGYFTVTLIVKGGGVCPLRPDCKHLQTIYDFFPLNISFSDPLLCLLPFATLIFTQPSVFLLLPRHPKKMSFLLSIARIRETWSFFSRTSKWRFVRMTEKNTGDDNDDKK